MQAPSHHHAAQESMARPRQSAGAIRGSRCPRIAGARVPAAAHRGRAPSAKWRPSLSMKMLPSCGDRCSSWRPLNMAAKRLGAGALRSVDTVVVKRAPPTLSVTCSLSLSTCGRPRVRAGPLAAGFACKRLHGSAIAAEACSIPDGRARLMQGQLCLDAMCRVLHGVYVRSPAHGTNSGVSGAARR